MNRRLIAKHLFLTFLGAAAALTTSAQVMTAPAFWRPPDPNLSISDGPTFDYGTIGTNVATDKTFLITNNGDGISPLQTGGSFGNARFTFKGGSFPGTGGTCGGQLNPGSSCTVIVTANSATAGSYNDTFTLNYSSGMANFSATRAITATFSGTPTKLAWSVAPAFIQVNTCTAVTVQSQDAAGGAQNVTSNTTVNLAVNTATNTTYYSNSGCTTTITTRTITSGTNSVSFYVRSTTANQSGIFIAAATGLDSGASNFTVTSTPTRLVLSSAPQMEINTCTAMTVTSADAGGAPSSVTGNTTVNLSTTGSNLFYSDSGCTSTITSRVITTGTNSQTFYTKNASIQSVTVTAADNAAVLTSGTRAVSFLSALTWWNTSYTRRIRIEINNLDQPATFTNQPILVTLTSSVINYVDLQAAGEDVRFVASDDTTQLPHEIEKWTIGGTSLIWVRVPSIAASSSSGFIYMYYKNPSASDGQNRTGIWTNYWGVWHLHEDPSGTSPQYRDGTSNARHGSALNSPTRTAGYIGDGAGLLSATDAIQINTDLAPALGASSTFSCWMKTSQVGNNTTWLAPGLTGVEEAGGGNDIFFGWLDGAGNIGVQAGNGAAAKSAYVVNNNAWRHVTITRNSGTGQIIFYINGVQTASATSETGNKTTSFSLFGEIGDTGGSPVNYNGYMDEIRVINSVRTADQVKADFKYMMNTHLSYSAAESYP